MSFFNSKEEVMDIQLTPYGKKKLAHGTFNPTYYAFFDDEIIYDGNSFGKNELQNEIQERILQNTPYLKVQSTFSSCSADNVSLENYRDPSRYMGIPLVSVDDSIKYAGSFDILFREGSIEKIELTGSDRINMFGAEYIPQIFLKEQIVKIVAEKNFELHQINPENNYPFGAAEDSTFIYINVSKIIFDIIENNSETFEDNFEVEFHKIYNSEDQTLLLSDSVINKKQSFIENDMLLDIPYFEDNFIGDSVGIEDEGQEFKEEDKKKLEYYFNIRFDENIDTSNQIGNSKLYIYDDPTSNISKIKGENC